jgi:iron complex outermembrane receptor protein
MEPVLRGNMNRSKLNIALLCAASAFALVTSAHAQNAESATTVESVVVTGSRVISDIANSPTPLTVVSTEQLAATTPSDIPDALNKLPIFLGSQSGRSTSSASSNAAGNVLNLRNFGTQRTLVLLDGHRVAPSNANGTVDTDVLPQMLMSRVDVVTGGASAVYGSDAVTGVVNFVLDKNFEGIKYNASAGTNNDVVGTQYQAGVAAGTSLFGGRGHLEGSIRYFHQDMIPITDLPYGKGGQAWEQSGNGTAANPYTTIPYGRLSNQNFSGLITCSGCAANGQQFITNGVIGPYNPGTTTGTGGLNIGGDGGYDQDGVYSASLRTAESFARFSYNVDDTTTFYIQGTASESGNYATWYPDQRMNPGANHPNTFFTNNPYLPAAAQAALQAGNTTNTFQLSELINNLSTGRAGDQNRVYVTGSVDRNLGMTVGLDGQLMQKFDWSLYYTHGESRQDEYNPNNTNNQKAYAASDAVLNSAGQPVCYVSTTPYANLYPGCVPINPFGVNTVTPSMYDYPIEHTQYVMTNIMDDVGGSISGSIFDLPAGPVKAAFSAEARWLDYTVNSNASPTATVDCTGLRLCSPTAQLYVQNVVANVQASNNVYEFAGEVNIPLLKDVPLIQDLSADVAGRFTNYSTSGDAETWKLGLDYHVNETVRFRGTASVDIRAPTLNDLFSPLQNSIAGLTDLLTNQTFSAPQHSQGNPDLKPEVAHTYTAGVVLTPSFIPGLTMSVDYYRINLSNGIANINYSSQAIQQLCIGSIGTSNVSPYCALAVRPNGFSRAPSNFPTYFISEALNSSRVRTEGIDIEADYNFDMADVMDSLPGSVSLRGLGSIQPYISSVNFPGAAATLTPMPKGRITAFIGYQIGNWGINLQDTWESGYSKDTLAGQVYVQPRVNSFNTLDMTVDKKFVIDDATADLYFTVQNIGNVQYPLAPTNSQNPGIFYPIPTGFGSGLGRYFTIGVRGNL